MACPSDLAFLFDVDNTLFDNDRFAADLGSRLEHDFGTAGRDRYWSIYGDLRDALGYADYLGALQRFRVGLDDEPALLGLSAYLLDYPFDAHLFPQALAAVAHLRGLGRTWILSDGDIVFQPRKIVRSGLWDAFEGRVIIDVHKERALAAMERRVAAARYVMIDDKPNLLATMKQALGERLVTVFVRQGHYAAAAAADPPQPAPDLVVDRIGALLACTRADFVPAHPPAPEPSGG